MNDNSALFIKDVIIELFMKEKPLSNHAQQLEDRALCTFMLTLNLNAVLLCFQAFVKDKKRQT